MGRGRASGFGRGARGGGGGGTAREGQPMQLVPLSLTLFLSLSFSLYLQLLRLSSFPSLFLSSPLSWCQWRTPVGGGGREARSSLCQEQIRWGHSPLPLDPSLIMGHMFGSDRRKRVRGMGFGTTLSLRLKQALLPDNEIKNCQSIKIKKSQGGFLMLYIP